MLPSPPLHVSVSQFSPAVLKTSAVNVCHLSECISSHPKPIKTSAFSFTNSNIQPSSFSNKVLITLNNRKVCRYRDTNLSGPLCWTAIFYGTGHKWCYLSSYLLYLREDLHCNSLYVGIKVFGFVGIKVPCMIHCDVVLHYWAFPANLAVDPV